MEAALDGQAETDDEGDSCYCVSEEPSDQGDERDNNAYQDISAPTGSPLAEYREGYQADLIVHTRAYLKI